MVERVTGELPHLVRFLAKPAELLPLGLVLTRALRALACRRPELFERIGDYGRCSFAIEPSDLDLSFLVVPNGPASRVSVFGTRIPTADVRIRGPILILLGLLDGSFDGDALFFDRTIAVSGRTDALLALRNAIEDAELRPSDLLGIGGRAAEMANASLPGALKMLQRLAGVPRLETRP